MDKSKNYFIHASFKRGLEFLLLICSDNKSFVCFQKKGGPINNLLLLILIHGKICQ